MAARRMLLLALTGLVLLTAAAPAAAQPHLREDGHVNLVWLDGGDSDRYREQVEPMVGVSVIAPTWWELAGMPGQLVDRSDPDLVAWAQARGMAVWPRLAPGQGAHVTQVVLGSDALRFRLVLGVVDALERSGADGVNVDFEQLHPETAPALTDFVDELAAAVPDAVISVTVPALTDSWDPGTRSTSHDRAGLGGAADYVVLAAYDQHDLFRRNGPVAGLAWAEAAVDYLLRFVPADRVLLGMPLYARDWVDDPAEPGGVDLDASLGMAGMAERLEAHDAVGEPDPVAGQLRYTYTDAEGREHRVWQEDSDSLRRRVGIMASHRLAGVASWRAGFESPEVWVAIDRAIAAAAGPEPDRRSGPPRMADTVPGPHVAPEEEAGAGGEPADSARATGAAGRDPDEGGLPAGIGFTGVLVLLVAVGAAARSRR